MATVRASLALYDGMTNPLMSIHRALNIVLNSFEAVQVCSGRAIDVQSIQQAREELARAATAFQNIENNAQRSSHEQSDFNRNIRDGTTAADSLHGSFKGILATVGSLASVKMALNWVQENLRLSDIQRNAERQLQTVLRNMGAQEVKMPVNASVDLTTNAEVRASAEGISDYAEQLAALDNQTLNNTLALDTALAARNYAGFSAEIADKVLNNTLVLDTAEAADIYNNFADKQIEVTLQAETASAVSAFEAIKSKAAEIQGRGMFGDEAMIAGAAELATYFSDAEAVMSMMDTLSNYAAGMSLGQEVDSRQMVDYATNLGKITTGTYTAMSQKGFQFSDAQKAIIEGTATQAQLVEVLGDEYMRMSADMQTAATINQVIAESWDGMYEAMSNTPHGKIVQLQNALGDVREVLGDRLYPTVLQFVDAFGSHLPQVESIMGGIANACSLLIRIMTVGFTLAVTVGGAIADNWSVIGPLVYGAAAAMLFYLGATKGVALAQAIATAAVTAYQIAVDTLSLGFAVLTGKTGAASAAQLLFNSALMASPITWVVIGFIALVAVIMSVCAWFAKAGEMAHSAFGIMTGGINVAISFLGNLLAFGGNVCLGLGAGFLALVYNIVNAFNNGITNVKGFFWDLLSTGLSVISDICEALNNLPFIEFDYSGVKAQAIKFANKAADTYESKSDYVDIGAVFSSGFNTFDVFQKGWVAEAFVNGANWGDSIAERFKLPTLEDLYPDMPTDDIAGVLDGIYTNVQDVAGNTAAMNDALDMTDEDLKYMRDIAERDTVNRYTTAEIVLNMGGITNNVSKMDDLDGIITHIVDGVNEAVEIASEGLHI